MPLTRQILPDWEKEGLTNGEVYDVAIAIARADDVELAREFIFQLATHLGAHGMPPESTTTIIRTNINYYANYMDAETRDLTISFWGAQLPDQTPAQ